MQQALEANPDLIQETITRHPEGTEITNHPIPAISPKPSTELQEPPRKSKLNLALEFGDIQPKNMIYSREIAALIEYRSLTVIKYVKSEELLRWCEEGAARDYPDLYAKIKDHFKDHPKKTKRT